jgi:hypothetical protein
MPPMGQAYVAKATFPDTIRVLGKWTGGGAAAAMTKAAADPSRGIASIAYNAATGKYLITFVDVGSAIVAYNITCASTTGVLPKDCNLILGSFSQATKSVQLEVWTRATDLAAAALVDLLNTFTIQIDITFTKDPVP